MSFPRYPKYKTISHGNGFSRSNLTRSRLFDLVYPKCAKASDILRKSGVAWLGEVPEYPCRRANGPTQPQPRATPWGNGRECRRALKGRPNRHRVIGSPLQGSEYDCAQPQVIRNRTAEFLVFTRQAGEAGIEVRVAEETVWLAQKRMATLFDVDIRTISEHLGRLFKERELQEVAVIRKFRTTAADGKGVISEHPCRRANGPTQPQPRATPWVSPRWFPGALKGRPKLTSPRLRASA
jgi:hypothetical protein